MNLYALEDDQRFYQYLGYSEIGKEELDDVKM